MHVGRSGETERRRQNTGSGEGREGPRLAVLIVATIVQAEQTAGRETDVSDDASRQMQVMMEETVAASSEEDGWSPLAKVGLLLALHEPGFDPPTSALPDWAVSLMFGRPSTSDVVARAVIW